MLNRLPMFFTSVAIGIVFAGAALVMVGSEAKARQVATVQSETATHLPASARVQAVFDKLMAIPKPTAEQIREGIKDMRSLMAAGELRVSADFLAASMIAAKGATEEDALLAHDLSICALSLGESRAKEWAAISHDKFLTRIKRKQRYGTQAKDGKVLPTVEEVPDAIRFILGVPSLMEAKRHAALGKVPTPPMATRAAPTSQLKPFTAITG